MVKRYVGVAVTGAALLLSLSAPAASGMTVDDKPSPSWKRIGSTWVDKAAVAVTDVTTIGRRAWVVGNTTKSRVSTPWAQDCGALRCQRSRLPHRKGMYTRVSSVAASSRQDIWAVGAARRGANPRSVPLWWHYNGSRWRLLDTPDRVTGRIGLTDVVVANESKAFALGRQDYLDGVTSTLYRWNGTGWKEISALRESVFPKVCGNWYKRRWSDVTARSGEAVLVGACGSKATPVVLEQGNARWVRAVGNDFPKRVSWDQGAFVGQQLWLVGSRHKQRVIYARDGRTWSRVPTRGIPDKAVVTDIAGAVATKVWAVGWIRTGHGHHLAASWRWGGGRWHPTDVPAGVSRSRLQAVSIDGSAGAWAAGTDEARPRDRRAIILRER